MLRKVVSAWIALGAAVIGYGCQPAPTESTAPPAVTPPVRVVEGLFDRSISGTLGLPQIPGQHALLYRATDDGYKFCHHPNIVLYKNRLAVMWSNGIVGERRKRPAHPVGRF